MSWLRGNRLRCSCGIMERRKHGWRLCVGTVARCSTSSEKCSGAELFPWGALPAPTHEFITRHWDESRKMLLEANGTSASEFGDGARYAFTQVVTSLFRPMASSGSQGAKLQQQQEEEPPPLERMLEKALVARLKAKVQELKEAGKVLSYELQSIDSADTAWADVCVAPGRDTPLNNDYTRGKALGLTVIGQPTGNRWWLPSRWYLGTFALAQPICARVYAQIAVDIYCTEVFRVKDAATGESLQGTEEPLKVRHRLVFEADLGPLSGEMALYGRRVVILDSAAEVERLADTHSPWRPEMAPYCGREGLLVAIGENVYEVKFSDGKRWVYNKRAIKEVLGPHTLYTPGALVEVSHDRNEVERLADGHGGWNEKMAAYCGRFGLIINYTKGGGIDDVQVQFSDGKKFLYNPQALRVVPARGTYGVRLVYKSALKAHQLLYRGLEAWKKDQSAKEENRWIIADIDDMLGGHGHQFCRTATRL